MICKECGKDALGYTAFGITSPVEHGCPAELVRIRRDEKQRLLEIERVVLALNTYGHFERDHGEAPADPSDIEALKTLLRVTLGSTDTQDLLDAANALQTGSAGT